MGVVELHGGGAPPPLYKKRPCIVSGGGGRGTRHFHFPKFTEKFDIELLPHVCWLDKVVAGRQPKLQPNLLPRWQPSLQPSLQLESPSLWPLLSMCSSSKSSTLTKESGTQSLGLISPEHASQTAVFRCISSSGGPC